MQGLFLIYGLGQYAFPEDTVIFEEEENLKQRKDICVYCNSVISFW